MPKHVFMFIPAFGNTMTTTTALTSHAIKDELASKGINVSISALSFPDIAELRSIVATIWIDTLPNVDYLLFIDSDMGFPAQMVTDMILFDEPLVGSIYPQRKQPLSWAGSGSGGGSTERRGNFMAVEGVGMGCTLIKREVMYAIMQKFPEVIDNRISMHPAFEILRSAGANRLIRAFEKMDMPERGIISEDLSFCIRWNQCGGRTWAAIGYDMNHVGMYNYSGNYLGHINQMQAQMQAQQEAALAQGQQVALVSPKDGGVEFQSAPVMMAMPGPVVLEQRVYREGEVVPTDGLPHVVVPPPGVVFHVAKGHGNGDIPTQPKRRGRPKKTNSEGAETVSV